MSMTIEVLNETVQFLRHQVEQLQEVTKKQHAQVYPEASRTAQLQDQVNELKLRLQTLEDQAVRRQA